MLGFRVDGNSMVGAGICDGDIIKVDPDAMVHSGDIAVVEVHFRKTTVKHVVYDNGTMILQAANPEFPPFFIEPPYSANVVGRVMMVERWL